MLNVLLIFIILALVGGIIYYFVFLEEDPVVPNTETTDDEDPIEPENKADLREVSIELTDKSKSHLENIYGADVLNAALELNNTEGAPGYMTCSGMFQPFKQTCRHDKELGLRWNWYNDNEMLGPRCHMLAQKYRITYYNDSFDKEFDVYVDPETSSLGVHGLSRDVNNGASLQIVPVYGDNYAVCPAATHTFGGTQKLRCSNVKDDINGDINTVHVDDI